MWITCGQLEKRDLGDNFIHQGVSSKWYWQFDISCWYGKLGVL